jgi:methyl-accepting chemotaxis protein WspA
MKLRLRTRIITLSSVAVLATVGMLLGLLKWADGAFVLRVMETLGEAGEMGMERMVEDIWHRCDTADLLVRQRLTSEAERLGGKSGLLRGNPVQWSEGKAPLAGRVGAEGTVRTVDVRQVVWEGKPVPLDRDPETGKGLLCAEWHIWEVAASVYWRADEAGNMACVASTALEENGKTRVGRLRPAAVEGGIPDPAVERVLKGETHWSSEWLGGEWLLLLCQPLQDAQGRVTGMLELETPVAPLEAVRVSIEQSQPGSGVTLWLMGGEGLDRGHYIAGPKPELTGEDLWRLRDTAGRPVVQDLIRKAMAQPEGKAGSLRGTWKGPGEAEEKEHLVAVTYFAPWDWVIGATADDQAFTAAREEIQGMMNVLFREMAISGAIVLLIVVGGSILIGRGLARPIERLVRVASMIAAGNLRTASATVHAAEASGVYETDRLADAFRRMVGALSDVVGQVKGAGIQVAESGEGITASARRLEQSTEEQAGATTRTAETAREISRNAQALAVTANQVADAARDAAMLAGESRQGLAGMEENMKGLMGACGAISGHLADINARTGNIGGIVTAITKIADQTNLLSLNAAIEAEKAGEYGRGFSVVAQEVRRLADQTAVATLHIERVIRDMSGAVTSGVTEMDRFVERVREAISGVQNIGGRMERMLEQVQALTPRIDEVLRGMQSQSEGAESIRDSMERLDALAAVTRESIRDFGEVAQDLNAAVEALRAEVSRFTTDAPGA